MMFYAVLVGFFATIPTLVCTWCGFWLGFVFTPYLFREVVVEDATWCIGEHR